MTKARQQWPNRDPIGQTVAFGNMDGNLKPLTIVGIVGDVRAEGLDRPASSVISANYEQRGPSGNSSPMILLRTDARTGPIVAAARSIFHNSVWSWGKELAWRFSAWLSALPRRS